MTIICVFCLYFLGFCSLIQAQQPYVAKATTNCTNTADSALGYNCNGLNTSCQAYLTFRSQPPYNTVASISTLLSSDPSQLSAINSVSETASFDTNKLVIVPVDCSCSGNYSQANTSIAVPAGDGYLRIANNTFQGLSTCQAIADQNSKESVDLSPGDRIAVPLRCACPTKNQVDLGIRYLLSYLVLPGDTVSVISVQFGASTDQSLEANSLSEQDNIYPYTTFLIPLENPPTSNQTIAPPPPPASPPPPSSPSPNTSDNGSSKTLVYVLVGVLGGIALILLLGGIIFYAFFRRSKKGSDPEIVSTSFEEKEKPSNRKMDQESQDFLESISSVAQSIKVYNFKELEAATENFSPSCLIKGSVYRGCINGDHAAIKKMDGDVSKEIELLNKVNHFNLIRLSGVCFSNSHWYLVYEYAANGALSDWIYNSSNNDENFLSWTQKVQIALDVATGLNYLHGFTSPPYVHKDIRSGNVLLDSDFRAKIANLAMARSTQGPEGEFLLTRHIVGTKGYMAPEYLENGLVSTKLDVYAFGILMLEIVTGKEIAAIYTEENLNLSDMLDEVLSTEDGQQKLKKLIDPSMQGSFPLEIAVSMMKLIHSCLNKNPAYRPTMDETTRSLARILTISLSWETSNASGNYSSSTSS